MKVIAVLFCVAAVCHGQSYFQSIASPQFGSLSDGSLRPPLPVARAIGGFSQGHHSHPGHRAVIQNSEQEALLPEHLKNPFYKNPRIASALAKESWFINGEEEVREREAEKIPRQKVFSILKQAGFI